MRQLLSSHGVGLVLLGEILRDIQAFKDRLSTVDLTKAEGVHEALKAQGTVEGLNRVIDKIFDLAERAE